jgi:hypothetical protein
MLDLLENLLVHGCFPNQLLNDSPQRARY